MSVFCDACKVGNTVYLLSWWDGHRFIPVGVWPDVGGSQAYSDANQGHGPWDYVQYDGQNQWTRGADWPTEGSLHHIEELAFDARP